MIPVLPDLSEINNVVELRELARTKREQELVNRVIELAFDEKQKTYCDANLEAEISFMDEYGFDEEIMKILNSTEPGELLHRMLDKHAQIINAIPKAWNKLVGPEIQEHRRNLRMYVLYLVADDIRQENSNECTCWKCTPSYSEEKS